MVVVVVVTVVVAVAVVMVAVAAVVHFYNKAPQHQTHSNSSGGVLGLLPGCWEGKY